MALRRAYIKRHHEFLISVKSCTSLERTPDDSLRYQSVIFSLIRALDKVRRSLAPSLTDTGKAGWPLYASLPHYRTSASGHDALDPLQLCDSVLVDIHNMRHEGWQLHAVRTGGTAGGRG